MLTRLARHSGSDAAGLGILNWRSAVNRSLDAGMLRDSRNYFLSKIVPGAAGLLSVIVFVRLVGYAEYGRYAVLYAAAMAFGLGLSGWLSQGTLRFQSKYSAPADSRSFHHATRAGTVLSVTVGGLALAIALWLSHGHSAWSDVVSLGFFAVALAYNVVFAQLQASLRSGTVLAYESLRSVGGFVFPVVLVLAFGRKDHRLLLLGILLGYLLPLLLRAIAGRGESTADHGHVSWRLALPQRERTVLGELWRYGWPVGLWILCQQGLAVCDRYFIQRFAGYSAAGIYASMYDLIVRSLSLVFAPITLAVHPLVMRHWNLGEQARSVQVIRSALRWQLVLFLPIGAVLFLASSALARITLGQPNREAASMVLPLAIGGFFWQAALLAHKPLEVLCRTRSMLAGILAALAINVCGNYFLIPRFGFRAAAYVMVASSLAYLLAVRIMTPKSFRAPDAVLPENAPPVLAVPPAVNTQPVNIQ